MTAPENTRERLAEVIWNASRADEGTISATGANHVATAVVTSAWLAAHDAQVRADERQKVEAEVRERTDEPMWSAVVSAERCGYAVLDGDGNEQPCDRPATGWRWYQDVGEHEDMLDVPCDWHANEGGRRIHEAEAELARIRALLADEGTVETVADAICISVSGWPDPIGAWTDEARAVLDALAGLIGEGQVHGVLEAMAKRAEQHG